MSALSWSHVGAFALGAVLVFAFVGVGPRQPSVELSEAQLAALEARLRASVPAPSCPSAPAAPPGAIQTEAPIERRIPIVAVSAAGEGALGFLTLRLIPGNSNVLINTNPFLEPDLQYSANVAVATAKQESGVFAANKDYIFSFEVDSQLVGGGSAGAAMALVTMAALTNRTLDPQTAVTGAISPDGRIGQVGGILEKAKAAHDAGMTAFLVPDGQSTITYYERVVEKEPIAFSLVLQKTRVVPRTLDLAEYAKEEWGLTVTEVKTLKEAEALMLR